MSGASRTNLKTKIKKEKTRDYIKWNEFLFGAAQYLSLKLSRLATKKKNGARSVCLIFTDFSFTLNHIRANKICCFRFASLSLFFFLQCADFEFGFVFDCLPHEMI